MSNSSDRNPSPEEPDAKRAKLEEQISALEKISPDLQEQDKKMTISASQLFEGMLSNMPGASKKETLNAFIQTLQKLRDKVDDSEGAKDDEEIVVVDESTSSNIVHHSESPQRAYSGSSSIAPTAVSVSPQTNVLMPPILPISAGANGFHSSDPQKMHAALNKMPVLQTIPTLPTMNSRNLLLQQHQDLLLRQQQLKGERPRMLHPQMISTMETSSLMQKERAHQQAMQAMSAQLTPASESPEALAFRIQQKIIEGVQANCNGKASDAEAEKYLKQNFFMLLENDSYIYVPNPWLTKPKDLQVFINNQKAQSMPVMLPPRPPVTPSGPRPLAISSLPVQLPGSMLSPASVWPSAVTALHQQPAFQLQQQTAANMMTGLKTMSLPLIDNRPRKNDWSVRGIPLPTCLHVQCNCFQQFPFYATKK